MSDTIDKSTKTPWIADPDDREGYEWNIHILQESNPNIRVCFMSNGPSSAANARLIVTAVNERSALLKVEEALRKIIDASRAYLPPDGISREEFVSRVLGASDNAEIVAALSQLDEVRNGK